MYGRPVREGMSGAKSKKEKGRDANGDKGRQIGARRDDALWETTGGMQELERARGGGKG